MWNVLYDKGDTSNQWEKVEYSVWLWDNWVATWKKNQVCTFHPKPR